MKNYFPKIIMMYKKILSKIKSNQIYYFIDLFLKLNPKLESVIFILCIL